MDTFPSHGSSGRRTRGRILAGSVAALAILITYVVSASSRAPESVAASLPGAAGPTALPAPPAPPAPTVGVPLLGISAPDLAAFDRFTTVTGTVPEVFDVFEAWGDDRPFDLELAEAVRARGARLSITWEPWDSAGAHTRQPDYSLRAIAAGEHDAYIDRFARSVQRHGHPVTLRLMHEMNGNWYPWGSGVNGNRSGDFVAAYRHVHDRFTALGVANVQWLWAPNAVYPGAAPLAPLFPGDAYVDAVGVSNYNWGDEVRDGYRTGWAGFGELFDPSLAELRTLTDRPVWITETGSSAAGGSKARWIAETLALLPKRSDVVGLVWFDHVDEGRAVDWRIENDPDAARAWKDGFDARPRNLRHLPVD